MFSVLLFFVRFGSSFPGGERHAFSRVVAYALGNPFYGVILLPHLLAPVYGWLTEGFDTLDLKEAKALLQELAASD
jgi:hypothetical protein